MRHTDIHIIHKHTQLPPGNHYLAGWLNSTFGVSYWTIVWRRATVVHKFRAEHFKSLVSIGLLINGISSIRSKTIHPSTNKFNRTHGFIYSYHAAEIWMVWNNPFIWSDSNELITFHRWFVLIRWRNLSKSPSIVVNCVSASAHVDLLTNINLVLSVFERSRSIQSTVRFNRSAFNTSHMFTRQLHGCL